MSNNYTIGDGTIKNIANAIRAQEESAGNIQVSNFASRISALVPTIERTGDISNVNTEYYGVSSSTIASIGSAIKAQDGLTGPVSGFAQRILNLKGNGTYLTDPVILPYYEYETILARRSFTYEKTFNCNITKQDLPSDILAYDNIDDYNLGMFYALYLPPGTTRTTGDITITDVGNGYVHLYDKSGNNFRINKTDGGPYTAGQYGEVGYVYGLVVDQNNYRSISVPLTFNSAFPLYHVILFKAPVLYKNLTELARRIAAGRTSTPPITYNASAFNIIEGPRRYSMEITKNKVGVKDSYSDNRSLIYQKLTDYGNAIFTGPTITTTEQGHIFNKLPYSIDEYEPACKEGTDWTSPQGGSLYSVLIGIARYF